MASVPHLLTLVLLLAAVFEAWALPERCTAAQTDHVRAPRSFNVDYFPTGELPTAATIPMDSKKSVFHIDYHAVTEGGGEDESPVESQVEPSSSSNKGDEDLEIHVVQESSNNRVPRSVTDSLTTPNRYRRPASGLRESPYAVLPDHQGDSGDVYSVPRSRKWITQMAHRVPDRVYAVQMRQSSLASEGRPGDGNRRPSGGSMRGRIVETADGRRFRITSGVVTLYER